MTAIADVTKRSESFPISSVSTPLKDYKFSFGVFTDTYCEVALKIYTIESAGGPKYQSESRGFNKPTKIHVVVPGDTHMILINTTTSEGGWKSHCGVALFKAPFSERRELRDLYVNRTYSEGCPHNSVITVEEQTLEAPTIIPRAPLKSTIAAFTSSEKDAKEGKESESVPTTQASTSGSGEKSNVQLTSTLTHYSSAKRLNTKQESFASDTPDHDSVNDRVGGKLKSDSKSAKPTAGSVKKNAAGNPPSAKSGVQLTSTLTHYSSEKRLKTQKISTAGSVNKNAAGNLSSAKSGVQLTSTLTHYLSEKRLKTQKMPTAASVKKNAAGNPPPAKSDVDSTSTLSNNSSEKRLNTKQDSFASDTPDHASINERGGKSKPDSKSAKSTAASVNNNAAGNHPPVKGGVKIAFGTRVTSKS